MESPCCGAKVVGGRCFKCKEAVGTEDHIDDKQYVDDDREFAQSCQEQDEARDLSVMSEL